MGVLAEFVRKEAEQLRGEVNRRAGNLKEWERAVAELNDQLRKWVAEADGGHQLLEAQPLEQFPRHESLLGEYRVPGLSITLGGKLTGRAADIVPRARYVMATIKPPGESPRRADGMVEIKSGSNPEYYLFRLADPSGDRWFIRGVTQWNADPEYGTVEPLTSDRFEAALLSVLR